MVTHRRLAAGEDGGLRPDGELEEPLVVRPTSETIFGVMMSRWIQSYRDLPLLLNQWANVVRWEMRTRAFLRTTEFLWQEGHTAHATAEEAREETERMLNVYADFARDYMAMPVVKGEKTEVQRFPGAVSTYCIEAMVQDRKALQAGTSHFLGQNFARASDIKFLDQSGQEQFVWTTSWGVSTRLIGGLVMMHGDDDGLALPPRLAPTHVVILPVIHSQDAKAEVMGYCEALARELSGVSYDGRPLSVELDARDARGGEKVWRWIRKGVPIRLEIGPRDIASDSVFIGRRDREHRDRYSLGRAEFVATVPAILDEVQAALLARAEAFLAKHTVRIDSKDEFYEFFTPENRDKPEIHGGFALSHWSGEAEVEEQIAADLNVTIRAIPLDAEEEEGRCVISGRPSPRRVVFAKAY